jgi:hypothetical protein
LERHKQGRAMAQYDDEYFKKQFEGLPPKAAAIIALRAAMRVFPVLAQRRIAADAAFWFWPPEDRAHHTLVVCRCFQSSVFVNSLMKDASLADELDGQHISVWYDGGLIGGQPYRDVLRQRIETVRAVVVFWTESSVSSEWVRAEAELAREHNKLICLRDPKLEPTRIPMPFAANQHIVEFGELPGLLEALALKGAKPRI